MRKQFSLIAIICLIFGVAVGQRETLKQPEVRRVDSLAVTQIVIDFEPISAAEITAVRLTANISIGAIQQDAESGVFYFAVEESELYTHREAQELTGLTRLADRILKRYCQESGRCLTVPGGGR